MSYGDVYLENIDVPAEAFDKAKKNYEWQYEVAPGVYRMLWHARDDEERPAFFYKLDKMGGFKHGISVNFANKKMSKINTILKNKTGMSWKEYLLLEIDKNPVLGESEDAFIFEWQDVAVYLWTRKEEETAVLLAECSKAIRKLVSEDEAQLNKELQSALDEGNVEEYTELFVELIGEGSKKEIELAFKAAKVLLENNLDYALLAAMAVATIQIGTKPLKIVAKEHEFARQIADMDDDFNNDFILSLQQFYQDAMYAGNDWKASKELVKRYYSNISEVMEIYGYVVNKMAIMTIIFLFYNDVIEGIDFGSYMDDEDYRDDEWPHTDTDLTFWVKFDPDSITGMKTAKGGYSPNDEDYDKDDDNGEFKKYLEYEDDNSHKIWSIEQNGNSLTVQFGKAGTAGQAQVKVFESEEKAEKEALKLYNAKIKKGYKEV